MNVVRTVDLEAESCDFGCQRVASEQDVKPFAIPHLQHGNDWLFRYMHAEKKYTFWNQAFVGIWMPYYCAKLTGAYKHNTLFR
jgi:hypothetical protein